MSFKMSYCTLRWREPDLLAALAVLRQVGWQGWEGRLPLDWMGPPSRLQRICQDTEMPMVVFTASGSPDNTDWAHVERNRRRMDYAAAMEVDCFMFMSGPKPEGRAVCDDDIRAAAERAEAWAEYAEQFGLELSYHIHTNTLIDSKLDWQRYMCGLEKAKLCIDVSHAELWGYDPVEAIRDYSDRINYIHLQDYSSTSTNTEGQYVPVWCDVGDGRMEFRRILDALEEIGYKGWVTSCPGEPVVGAEDPLSEVRRSAKARGFLKRLGC